MFDSSLFGSGTACARCSQLKPRIAFGKGPYRGGRSICVDCLAKSQTKICTGCGQEKAHSDFAPRKRYLFGLDSECRSCKAMRVVPGVSCMTCKRLLPRSQVKKGCKTCNDCCELYGYRPCGSCGLIKVIDDFYPNCSTCKGCTKTRAVAFVSLLPVLTVKRYNLLGCAKRRAKNRHVPFSLSAQDVENLLSRGVCAYCSKPVSLENKKIVARNSATIDRVIPELGYISGNVVLSCHRCNRLKSDGSASDIKLLADNLHLIERMPDAQCALVERLGAYTPVKQRTFKARQMWESAKGRAQRYDVPFGITQEWIGALAHCLDGCQYCGRQFGWNNPNKGKSCKESSPSLDRFNPVKGYTVDNTFLVCMRCNTIKVNAAASELLELANNALRITEQTYTTL